MNEYSNAFGSSQSAGMIVLIASLILAVFYFKIYHSMFRTTYFGNPFSGMLKEFGCCFIAAFLTVGIVIALAGRVFKVVGGILAVVLKIILIIAVGSGIVGGIYLLVKQIKKKTFNKKESIILEEAATSDEMQKKGNETVDAVQEKPLTDIPNAEQKPSGDESASVSKKLEKDTNYRENIIKVLEKNERYYIQQFENIENTGKSKINWASFCLGLIHAAYRNVWKEWLKVVSVPLWIEAIAAVLTVLFVKMAPKMLIVSIPVMVVAGIGFSIAQIIFSLHFNLKYKSHVDKKVTRGDFKPDVSTVRAVVVYCIFSTAILIIVIGIILFPMLVPSAVAESADTEYISESYSDIDDFKIKKSETIASETFSLNKEDTLAEGTYVYDDGSSIYSTAEIITDDIGLKINIEAMGYGGHQQGFASGYLNSVRENMYSCIVESDLGTFILESVDDGFIITAHPAEGVEDMLLSIEGHYILKDATNTESYYETGQAVNNEHIEMENSEADSFYDADGESTPMKVVNCKTSITLRESPDSKSSEICQIPLGDYVAATDDTGTGYYYVNYQGYYGYVLAEYLSEDDTKKTEKDFILPDSDNTSLEQMRLGMLTQEELRIAKNEIYARHGRKFTDNALQDYFDSKSWYTGVIEADEFNEDLLSPLEKSNIKIIDSYRTE